MSIEHRVHFTAVIVISSLATHTHTSPPLPSPVRENSPAQEYGAILSDDHRPLEDFPREDGHDRAVE